MRLVLRQRDFGLLWLAGLISIAGDWMLIVALPVAVYELSGSATALSTVVVVRLIPGVALSSVAGVFIDRWDRKRTMVIANLIRGPMLLLLLFVDSADDLWIVYVVAATNSAVSTFFDPAENALLPRLVSERDLVPANALNSLNNQLGTLIGPLLGGAAAVAIGLGGVAMIDAATYLIAAGLVALIAAPGRPERAAETDAVTNAVGAWHAVWGEWMAGLRLVRAQRTLSLVFAAYAIIAVGDVGFSTLLFVWVEDALGGEALEFGWLLTSQAVGGMAGAAVLASRGAGQPAGRLLGWGLVAQGVLGVLFIIYPAVVGGVWLGILLRLVTGVPVTAMNLGGTTLLQEATADAYRGRVFGARNMTFALVSLALAPVVGLATEWVGVVPVLTLLSAICIPVGMVLVRLLGGHRPGVAAAVG